MIKLVAKFFTNRIAIFTTITITEIFFFSAVFTYLSTISKYFYFSFLFFSIIAAFEILARETYPEYKIAWILVITALPGFGFAFYLILGRKNISKNKKEKYQSAVKNAHSYLPCSENITEDKITQKCAKIIYSHCKMPAFYAKTLNYYSSGEKFYVELMKELVKAKKYIFLEYFIIKPGCVWNNVLNILKQKAKKGVDVRIIYDDFGSLLNLPRQYPRMLKKYNIKSIKFNPIVPFFDARMNIRNHRKAAVIDGRTAFISGANISDEYSNIQKPFGEWKDFGAKITGNAANSFAISFLDTWRKNSKTTLKVEKFLTSNTSSTGNIVVPFQDSPLFKSSVYEDVLLNLIYSSKSEINITTPYLVPTSEIQSALISAARRGVRINILIPGVSDKKSIYQMSKTFALSLSQNGINIFVYSPGFLHSKLFTVDGKYSVVGSSNLDLRSIHSNYEINMFAFSEKFAEKINQDIKKMITKSSMLNNIQKTNFLVRIYRTFIKLFAPLM